MAIEMKVRRLFSELVWSSLLLSFASCRESHEWKQSVVLSNGTEIEVIQERSRGKLIPLGHSPVFIGGKRYRHILTFEYQGQVCQWEGAGIPFLLNEHGGKLYLAVVKDAIGDAEYRSGPDDYMMFVWNGLLKQWKRIGRVEFPRQIAVQNLNTWYVEMNDGSSEMIYRHPEVTEKEQNPFEKFGRKVFRDSVTANFWRFLETDEGKWVWWRDTTQDFVDAFRKKWIDQ
jgi:hypothetical protein